MYKKVIIVLIAIICVSSGAFAILSNQPLENTNNTSDNNLINDVKDTSFSLQSFLNNIKNDNIIDDFKDLQQNYGYLVNVNGELRHYINDNGAYYLESEGETDKYIQCVECGGFIPIGHITNPLPEAAICHHSTMFKIILSENTIYSRDEAYNLWVKLGSPVCDDFHLHPEIYDLNYYVIECYDCGGCIFLENFNRSEFSSAFDAINLAVYNTNDSSKIKLCSHYNGSLDLFNTPIEDFHPGWFKSINDYNKFMYKAIHSLKDDSNSLDNKTLKDISMEKWDRIWKGDIPNNFSYVEYKSLNCNISNNPQVNVDYEPPYTPEQTESNVSDVNTASMEKWDNIDNIMDNSSNPDAKNIIPYHKPVFIPDKNEPVIIIEENSLHAE